MIWFLSILAFVVIFSLLILIHEAGHFFAAKKAGVKVEEFGMGMPPRIWGYKPKKSETLYSINAIPFGGFVRLYGEDSHDAKIIKNPKSFASKSAWQKITIIVAGVVMNLLLAFVLLLIGFLAGMQPLLVTSQDVIESIDSGVIELQEGIVVKDLIDANPGFQKGDVILSINDKKILFGNELAALKDQEVVDLKIKRAKDIVDLRVVNSADKQLFVPYDVLPVSRVVIADLEKNSDLYKAGLRDSDVIFSVNGKQIFSYEDLQTRLFDKGVKELVVSRSGEEITIKIEKPDQPDFLISEVLPDSNAAKAGLKNGDKIWSINGVMIDDEEKLAKVLADKSSEKVTYSIVRGSSQIEYYVNRDQNGLTGVFISPVFQVDLNRASFYVKSIPYSITNIGNVRYSLWEAPGKALEEMGRLSVLTAQMFVNVLANIFTSLAVPEGVAGPVGIAQMTFVFVQEGLVSLIRFAALLSLSLGVINILPFPGLDGGRLLLILIPLIIGKKINPKTEALIHVFGFLILMLLIFLITVNDISKLF